MVRELATTAPCRWGAGLRSSLTAGVNVDGECCQRDAVQTVNLVALQSL
jgi:hypothetical protein